MVVLVGFCFNRHLCLLHMAKISDNKHQISISVEEITFVRGLEDIKVTSANVTVTFECELSKDGLKVEWFKGDKKLRRDDVYNMSSVGKVHTLVIDNVEVDSVGEYSAVFQTISTSAKLSMEGDYL